MLQLAHKNLDVYKISLLLVKEIYKLTKDFPPEEKFILVAQLRRAAVSIPSNIAEGAARKTYKEKNRFFDIARASIVEVDTQIEISLLLDFLKKEQLNNFESYEESVFKMLYQLIKNIEKRAALTINS
jgi:four helix bundle protein